MPLPTSPRERASASYNPARRRALRGRARLPEKRIIHEFMIVD